MAIYLSFGRDGARLVEASDVAGQEPVRGTPSYAVEYSGGNFETSTNGLNPVDYVPNHVQAQPLDANDTDPPIYSVPLVIPVENGRRRATPTDAALENVYVPAAFDRARREGSASLRAAVGESTSLRDQTVFPEVDEA